jgi:hypothetical protein
MLSPHFVPLLLKPQNCRSAVSVQNHGTIIYASCASGCIRGARRAPCGARKSLKNSAIFGDDALKAWLRSKVKSINESLREVIALDLTKSAALGAFSAESERTLNLYDEASPIWYHDRPPVMNERPCDVADNLTLEVHAAGEQLALKVTVAGAT